MLFSSVQQPDITFQFLNHHLFGIIIIVIIVVIVIIIIIAI